MAENNTTQPYVKRKRRKKFAWICFSVGLVGCTVLGILAFLGQTSGNFSIKLNEADAVKLTMSQDSTFSAETSYLRATGLVSASTIAADILPEDTSLDSNDGGSKNGPNYLCYTFFIKNNSTDKVSYNVEFDIDNYRNPVNQAVSLLAILRMRVFENIMTSGAETHAMTTFAKSSTTPFTKSDGTVESREPISLCTVNSDGSKVFPTTLSGNMKAENIGYAEMFKSNTICYDRIYENLQPQNVVRYTAVVWLEGNDPDCIGAEPVGASVTFSMHFAAIQEQ